MSKKNRNLGFSQAGQPAHLSHQAEYGIIKHDLIRVIALNIVYLAVILGLYYANQSSQLVDKWFAKVLHF